MLKLAVCLALFVACAYSAEIGLQHQAAVDVAAAEVALGDVARDRRGCGRDYGYRYYVPSCKYETPYCDGGYDPYYAAPACDYKYPDYPSKEKTSGWHYVQCRHRWGEEAEWDTPEAPKYCDRCRDWDYCRDDCRDPCSYGRRDCGCNDYSSHSSCGRRDCSCSDDYSSHSSCDRRDCGCDDCDCDDRRDCDCDWRDCDCGCD